MRCKEDVLHGEQSRLPIEDAFVSAVFGASSALEEVRDNVLYKLTLTVNSS